jgi:hypothetical protein
MVADWYHTTVTSRTFVFVRGELEVKYLNSFFPTSVERFGRRAKDLMDLAVKMSPSNPEIRLDGDQRHN